MIKIVGLNKLLELADDVRKIAIAKAAALGHMAARKRRKLSLKVEDFTLTATPLTRGARVLVTGVEALLAWTYSYSTPEQFIGEESAPDSVTGETTQTVTYAPFPIGVDTRGRLIYGQQSTFRVRQGTGGTTVAYRLSHKLVPVMTGQQFRPALPIATQLYAFDTRDSGDARVSLTVAGATHVRTPAAPSTELPDVFRPSGLWWGVSPFVPSSSLVFSSSSSYSYDVGKRNGVTVELTTESLGGSAFRQRLLIDGIETATGDGTTNGLQNENVITPAAGAALRPSLGYGAYPSRAGVFLETSFIVLVSWGHSGDLNTGDTVLRVVWYSYAGSYEGTQSWSFPYLAPLTSAGAAYPTSGLEGALASSIVRDDSGHLGVWLAGAHDENGTIYTARAVAGAIDTPGSANTATTHYGEHPLVASALGPMYNTLSPNMPSVFGLKDTGLDTASAYVYINGVFGPTKLRSAAYTPPTFDPFNDPSAAVALSGIAYAGTAYAVVTIVSSAAADTGTYYSWVASSAGLFTVSVCGLISTYGVTSEGMSIVTYLAISASDIRVSCLNLRDGYAYEVQTRTYTAAGTVFYRVTPFGTLLIDADGIFLNGVLQTNPVSFPSGAPHDMQVISMASPDEYTLHIDAGESGLWELKKRRAENGSFEYTERELMSTTKSGSLFLLTRAPTLDSWPEDA